MKLEVAFATMNLPDQMLYYLLNKGIASHMCTHRTTKPTMVLEEAEGICMLLPSDVVESKLVWLNRTAMWIDYIN